MYYYAVIELETGICYDIAEVEEPIIDDPSCIEIDSNDKSYLFRKKYVDGVWIDTTPAEAQQFEGAHIGIHGEWLDIVISGKADIDHVHDGYATADHSHTEYASSDDLQTLEDVVDTKADTSHVHSEYANANHVHNEYAAQVDLDILAEEVDSKASSTHNHNSMYASLEHNHEEEYSPLSHSHTASEIGAATNTHNHDSNYASISALNELSTTVSGKANISHSHDDRYFTETEINSKLAGKSDTTHTHTGVYDTSGSAASALASAQTYTDSKIDALVGEGASITLDTIGEISSAIEDNQDAIDLLNAAIANKANVADLNAHANDTEIHVTDAERNIWNAKSDFSGSYNDLTNKPSIPSISGLATEAYVNEAIDTLSEAVSTKANTSSLTSHTGNTTVHIAATERTNWNAAKSHADSTHAPTTNATQTASGLMSKTDKIKLDGIADGANNYTLPSAGASLGGVKTGGDVTISSGVITVNDDSHNHIISNVDGLQSALDSKAASGHNHDGVYYTETEIDTLLEGKANTSHTHTISNITNLQSTLDGKANASHGTHVSYSTTAPVMDGTASVGTATTVARSDHKHPTDTSRAAQTSLDTHTSNKSNPHSVTLAQLGVTATATELNALDGITATVTELNYVDGVTSNIQTQLNGKAASGHTHNYAGSSSAGGAATSANKLNTNAGSATQPVYFANGIPVATTYTLGASVPAGAKFTDTTYGAATTSANGLMSASDKSKLDGMVTATITEVETYLGI